MILLLEAMISFISRRLIFEGDFWFVGEMRCMGRRSVIMHTTINHRGED